jgi:hypothetical protein
LSLFLSTGSQADRKEKSVTNIVTLASGRACHALNNITLYIKKESLP